MLQIKAWLDQKRQEWDYDFIGIAVNTAPANQPKEIRWRYVSGNLSEHYQGIRLRVGRGIAGLVWQTAREHQDDHIFDKPALLLEYPIARLEKLEAVAGIPLMAGQTVIGILLLGSRQAHAFSSDELAVVRQAVSEATALLQEERYE